MEVGRSLRGVRAAVFAAACVGVSAAGHVWMSGASVAAWALIVAVLAVGGAAYALGGRQRGFASIAGLMLLGEAGLHLLFSSTQRTAVESASASASSGAAWVPDLSRIKAAHPIPAADWLCGHGMAVASMVPMPWTASHGSAGMAGMVGVHVAAGLLCAWWLRRGEAAVFQLMRAIAGFVMPLLVFFVPGARPVPDLTVVVPDDAGAHGPNVRRFLVHALVRRGPPVPVFSM